VAECEDCARLSSADDHPSTTSASAAVLTPISRATSTAPSSCFSVIVPRLPFLPLSIRPLHHSTHSTFHSR
jgi:hypothetical protein